MFTLHWLYIQMQKQEKHGADKWNRKWTQKELYCITSSFSEVVVHGYVDSEFIVWQQVPEHLTLCMAVGQCVCLDCDQQYCN